MINDEAGVSPFQMRPWLGRTSIDPTTLYVHLTRKNAMKVIEVTSL
ncbi:MAG: hypothetical protein H0T49_03265 [Chloroflexia bacterium]|nr:hypothetical protein [Chloroflexia bacterium]